MGICRGGGRRWEDVGLVKRLAIDIDPLAPNLYLISGQPDDPFDEVPTLIVGVLEHDDVLPAWGPGANDPGIQHRNANAINEFVHQDMIPNLQGGHHGARGDFERLHHEGSNKQGQDDGNGQGLEPLAGSRLPPLTDLCGSRFLHRH